MGFWNAASWSISAELVAYLLFPWLVACSLWPRSHGQRFAVVAGIMVAYVLLTFAYAQTNNKMPWKTAIPGVLACFTTGLILYRARGAYARKYMAIVTDVTTAALPLVGIALAASATVAWPLVPLLAVWVYGVGEGGSLTSRLLSSRPAVFMGEISYSVYLSHGFIIGMLSRIVPEMNPPVTEAFGPALIALLASLVAILATATLLHDGSLFCG